MGQGAGIRRRVFAAIAAVGAAATLAACVPAGPQLTSAPVKPSTTTTTAPGGCRGHSVALVGDSILAFGQSTIRTRLEARGWCVVVYDVWSGYAIPEHTGIDAAIARHPDAIVFSFGANDAGRVIIDHTMTNDDVVANVEELLDKSAGLNCVRMMSVQNDVIGASDDILDEIKWFDGMIRGLSRPNYAVTEWQPVIDFNIALWWPVEKDIPFDERTHLWVFGPEVAFGGVLHLVDGRGGTTALANVIADSLTGCENPPGLVIAGG